VASRGHAVQAILGENQQASLREAEYTSCPAPRDDWFIRVSTLDIDGQRNVGVAHNSTVFFLGVPILYSPYLSFPLDNKRRSGFLSPHLRYLGQERLRHVPALLLEHRREPRRHRHAQALHQAGACSWAPSSATWARPTSGQLDGEYLPRDRITDTDRYFVGVRHNQKLWPGGRPR
jgi:LPS-assembly protein